MNKSLAFSRDQKVPFLLSTVEEVDLSLYQEAIKAGADQAASYDPETQTSRLVISAASSRTYFDTSTGVIFRDDEGKDT